MGCPHCAARDAEINRLIAHIREQQAYIKRLEAEIKRLERIIERLRRILLRILMYATGVIRNAGEVLSQKSGVPRGRWGFCKGAATVAETVKNLASIGG